MVSPSFVTMVMSFMGLASYYHIFVKNFTSIDTHFTRLTHKKVPFLGLDKYKESFQKLKILLTTTPILLLPFEGKNFVVFCDASLLGLGVILMLDRNVSVSSLRKLKPHKINYPNHDL